MKKKLIIIAVLVISFVTSILCGSEQNDSLNADGTYSLKKKYLNESDGCEVLNGVFKVFDESVLMLEHPASGDNIFYKVKNDSSIILKESFGNEPSAKNIKLYVLKKKV